ncbi:MULTISPECIES: hypothetical protein [unclassified Bradyrhizobium]|uniref:hypothetical protein n=1 Tax=unclassified Bradyrhizobium TaxID=2631580 RepID=UPI001FF98B73|nr:MULTISPECIES: hypothetical protein [unclassified Bradyrhizobium]MCK1709726.1 hypothetical protein [Bradyrhizobium sp. 143]MCK1725414.1 hypothetical protein [Bradyrhizobium sp. 142]
MKPRTCTAAALLTVWLGSMAVGSTITASLEKCRSANASIVANPNNGSLADIDLAFERAKAFKLAQCKDAEIAAKRLEEKQKVLESAINNADSAAAAATGRADKAVELQLASLGDARNQLWAIPNDPNDTNNKRFQEALVRFATSDQNIQSLSQTWDSIFAPLAGSPFKIMMDATDDEEFPTDARQFIQDYLDQIPPYLLGRGPAPREKLDFVFAQSDLSKWSAQLKKVVYAKPIKQRADKSLNQSLDPDVVETQAKVIRRAALSRFFNRNLTWGQMAGASGACSLARATLTIQIASLEDLVRLSPDRLRVAVSKITQPDIVDRKSLISNLRCDPSVDPKNLKSALRRWTRVLPDICAGKAPDIDVKVKSLLSDINIFLGDAGQPPADDTELTEAIGQELWSNGYDLATEFCAAGAK